MDDLIVVERMNGLFEASGIKLFQSVRGPLGGEALSEAAAENTAECLWWISCHCHRDSR